MSQLGITIAQPVDYLTKTYRYRHLMLHLARSDLRSRFRGSAVGAFWLLLNPLILTAIFSFIFGTIFNVPFIEYAPYLLIGIVVWEFISSMIGLSTQSILSAEGYLKQSRIPLLVFSLRSLIYNLICFVIALAAALIVTAALTGNVYGQWLWLIPVIALLVIFTTPLAVISGVVNTRFRDYQVLVGHLLTVLYYISPVFIVRKEFDRPQLQWFSEINPITACLDLVRDPVLYGKTPDLNDVAVVLTWSLAFWVIALITLHKTEPNTIHYF